MYVCIFLLNVGAHLQKSHIPRPHDTIPIPIKITPPRTSAFPDSFVPRVLPRHNPVSHIANVTTATISEQTTAITKSYPAVVNPTDNASITVLHLNNVFQRHSYFKDLILKMSVLDCLINVGFYFVLVPF